MFSSLTSFLESSDFARRFVTSASDETFSSADLASERVFSAEVAFFSASTLATSFSAACFLSKPAVFDSVTTKLKADTVAAWWSTSAWLASALARVALAVAKASLAELTTKTSAYLAVDNLDSKVAILASRIALFTFLASSTLVSGLTASLFLLESVWLAWAVVAATDASAPCTSVADTAPLPRNIKPAATATDAAPKLYLRIP